MKEFGGIIQKFQSDAPVLVSGLAKELGLSVMMGPHGPEICAALQRNKDGSFTIHVNEAHPKLKRRYEIAYELAHFILHRSLLNENHSQLIHGRFHTSWLGARAERNARDLAHDILMPWHLINGAIKDGASMIEDIAARLRVTPSAVAVRMGVPCEK